MLKLYTVIIKAKILTSTTFLHKQIQFRNDATANLTRFQAEELCAEKIFKTFPPEDFCLHLI